MIVIGAGSRWIQNGSRLPDSDHSSCLFVTFPGASGLSVLSKGKSQGKIENIAHVKGFDANGLL